jgi:VanZ family protein
MTFPEETKSMRISVTGLRLLTAVYTTILVAATHLPRLDMSIEIDTPVPGDKVAHFAAYGVLGSLVGLIAAEARHNWRRTFPPALAAIAAFALLDETTQPMFGRDAEAFDWVADVIGAAAGLAAAGCLAAAVRMLTAAVMPELSNLYSE